MSLFALEATRPFGAAVGQHLGVPLSEHEERTFDDGEHKARPLASVRDRDVFVVQSLYASKGRTDGKRQSVNDKLCRLLFFIGALKDASAGRVTAVVPYLCYAREDRKAKPRDPVTTRYVARLFEVVGADRLLTLEVHNLAAFQNAFRVPTDHLTADRLFADYFAQLLARSGGREVVVASPDVGGVKRAERFRETLSQVLGRTVASAFVEKKRSRGAVSGGALVGEVSGHAVVLFDDMISTGTTMMRAARACRKHGAAAVYAAAAHGLFPSGAGDLAGDPALDGVIVTNTISPFRPGSAENEKPVVLDAAPLFAEAIRRVRGGGSVVDLSQPSDEAS